MIVYKLVIREKDGRLLSLMEKGVKQVEYKPKEVSYPSIGVLYAFNSPEGAKVWMTNQNIELWEAEATGVTPTAYSTIVGCKSLKLLRKISVKQS